MNENEAYEQMEQEIILLANQYSVTRMKVSTPNFDREYRRGADGSFLLVQTKAVIRVLGKTTKVPIGATEEYKTFEEAFEATKKYWSEYYKGIRANRSAAQLRAEARRQKRYREKRKARAEELKRQQ
jgi:hypothetical protein